MTEGAFPGNPGVPEVVVPRVPGEIVLAPFLLTNGRGEARWSTRVRIAWSDVGLHVGFTCEDGDIWGGYRGRDEPLWEEEAVEVFLSPGPESPVRYLEFEFNPFGAVFDAMVDNPRGDRSAMHVRPEWNCEGLRSVARIDTERRQWHVDALLPWTGIHAGPVPPAVWRANFFRIERPRNAPGEFSAWSCPLTDPPDFHRPERFGLLRLAPAPRGETCSTMK